MHKIRNYVCMIKTTPLRPALGLLALKPREKCLGLTSHYAYDTHRWQDFNLLSREKETPDADEETSD